MAQNHAAHAAQEGRKRPIGLIVAFVIVLALAAAALFAYFSVKGDIAGGEKTGDVVEVSVEQGSGPATIAKKLQEAGLIKYPRVFRWYVGKQGAAGTLQYGDFEIEKGASYDEIIAALSQTVAAETVRVTFPEGSTAIAIADKMEEAGLCSAEDFLKEANEGDFSEFKFWQYVPSAEDAPDRFMKCEGYLFPNTYDFYKDDTVHNYVATFYAQFDQQMTDELYSEMDAEGLTLNQAVTLASFVQEEAGNDQDAKVAAVFRNRLAAGSPYPMLQSNASSYIQSDSDNNYLWNWVAPYYGGWDQIPINVRTAYDTYSVSGLTPGAISNPGIDAIKAALNPDPDTLSGGYYFFVTDQAGTYYYGHNETEHAANCQKAGQVNDTLK
ncbi:MAG: endolytic transglycosylase MltG [Faecalibacterium sp.]|jgi:UPF0755 protein|nr:endolytic transglycosylase MltG [Faecalibacterium sp.]